MKIAVCVPVHRVVPASFVTSWSALLAYSTRLGLNLGLMLGTEGSLEMKRNRLAVAARKSGADYLLWMDDDHTFPANALERLLNHDVAVVGCNCVTRDDLPLSTAVKGGERLRTTEALAKSDALEQVEGIGLGLALMKITVFGDLDKWAQSKGSQMAWPLFDSRTDHLGHVTIGEDMFFCGLLNSAGIPIHVDHRLSWEVGHLSYRVNTHGGTNDTHATPSPAGDSQGR